MSAIPQLLVAAVFAQIPTLSLEPNLSPTSVHDGREETIVEVIVDDPPITKRHGPALPIDQLSDHVPAPPGKLTLYADFNDVRGGHVVLYLVNRTSDELTFMTEDHVLHIKQEAKWEGDWRRAQTHVFGFCGNGRIYVPLRPGEFFRFLGRYPLEGTKVPVRYRMVLGGPVIWERLPDSPDFEVTSNAGSGRASSDQIEQARFDALAARESRDIDALESIARGEEPSGPRLESYRPQAVYRLAEVTGPADRERFTALLKHLADDHNPRVRSAALSVLARLAPTAGSLGIAKRHLSDHDSNVRAVAIYSLARLASTQPAAAKLFEDLLQSPDTLTRRSAARELGQMEATPQMLTWVAKMVHDSEPMVRLAAARALRGAARGSSCTLELSEQLLSHDDANVREEALIAWCIATERTMPVLNDFLGWEQDPEVIQAAVRTVAYLAREGNEDAGALLDQLLASPDPSIREQAREQVERFTPRPFPRQGN